MLNPIEQPENILIPTCPRAVAQMLQWAMYKGSNNNSYVAIFESESSIKARLKELKLRLYDVVEAFKGVKLTDP